MTTSELMLMRKIEMERRSLNRGDRHYVVRLQELLQRETDLRRRLYGDPTKQAARARSA